MLYIGADHRGFKLKEGIKKFLTEKEIPFEDLGNLKYEKDDDFPVFAKAVAKKVASSVANPPSPKATDGQSKGLLLCGSGIGMSIAANRFLGVRAGLCLQVGMAKAGRAEDDINILILPTEFVDFISSIEILETFLNTGFKKEKERYIRRRNMIDHLE